MEFRLLGRLEVMDGEADLTPTRPKQRALLAYLLLRAGEVVSSDDLVDTLWGERPPQTAATALHGHVSALRRLLGAERIETHAPGYVFRLADGDELDIQRFHRLVAEARPLDRAPRSEHLRRALALFRGEPLSEFRFQPFASLAAARLDDARVAASQQLIDADLELGRHAAVIPELEQLVADHPLREGLRGQLMLALYRAGRQAEALDVAQETRRTLDAELGVEPGPALKQLEHQILNQDARLSAPSPGHAAASTVAAIAPVTKPTGMVTFLAIDSARSAADSPEPRDQSSPADRMGELLRATSARHGGYEVESASGAMLLAFARARDAAACATSIHGGAVTTGLRLPIGLHSTTAVATATGYAGPGVRGAFHICRAAHPGQVLLSQATRDLLREAPLGEADVLDLGEHRLTDLERAKPLFQLVSPGLDRVFPPPRSLETRLSNLPVQPGALVGRIREIGEITRLLADPDVDLVTLTGPGGTGKTRLALHVAAELLDEFVDGVFFVDLAAVSDSNLVLPTIARTLAINESTGEPLEGVIARHIRRLRLLLVVDNLEQVLAAASAVAAIAVAGPGVKVLVTSRVPLRVSAESAYLTEPLAIPSSTVRGADVMQADSVELFASRAQAVRPEFAVGVQNAVAVAGICRVLDGLPLAIELAAARIGVLTPASLLELLGQRTAGVLSSRTAAVAGRHRTLERTVDWSYDLLEPNERALLARLGIFAGGWTLEAAEDVCGEGIAVLDGMASLIEHSLLRVAGTDTAPRFTMLETIREYAARRLEASGEGETFRMRHAEYFLKLAREAEPHLRGSPGDWPARLEREHDNLRAALGRLEAAGAHQDLLQLAGALWRFWYLRGYLTEGRTRLEKALQRDADPTPARGTALIGAAVMAINHGDIAAATRHAEEGLGLHTTLGDAWGAAYCQFMLGAARGSQGDLEGARLLYEESARIFRELEDEHSALLVTRNLASTYGGLGDAQRERTQHDDNLRRARATQNERIEASTLGALATIAYDEGRIQDALWMLTESLRIHHHLGDRLDTVVDLCRAARVFAFTGRADVAVRLLSSYAAAEDEVGMRREWVAAMNDETLTTIRRQLDEAAFDEAWREGKRLTVEEGVELALDSIGLPATKR